MIAILSFPVDMATPFSVFRRIALAIGELAYL
jgi:hypothetical protein